MRMTLAVLAAVLCAVSCSEKGGGDDDGGDSTECELGTERCGCDNGMCASGLTCLSETCVRGSGGASGAAGSEQTGGTAQGGSTGGSEAGGGGSGATTTGGQAGTSGTGGTTGGSGGTSSGAGGMPGGSGGTAGGRAGAGGASGASGSGGMCTADTQTDPNNCGDCGHVCRNQDGVFQGRGCNELAGTCCAAGECGNFLSDCVTEAMGFDNCSGFCASIGEQCVQRGCSNQTWLEYNDDLTICEEFGPTLGSSQDSCDTPIWDVDIKVRCCCTDTQ